MKPCKSCPFRKDSRHGLWSAAHYLLVAYLQSADIPSLPSMGCHQYNGKVKPSLKAEVSPYCGGWIRAAKDNVAIGIRVAFGRIDNDEIHDGYDVMSPEEMAKTNGIDMTRVPALRFDHRNQDVQSYVEWLNEHTELRNRLRADPEYARTFIVPGSPLANPPGQAEVDEIFGIDNAYQQDQP